MRKLLAVLSVMVLGIHAALAADAPWCRLTPAPEAVTTLAVSLQSQLTRVPQPVSHLHTEGTLPHQGLWDTSVAAKRDLPVMRDAALVWRANGDPAAFAMANRMVLAWAATYQPNFNPIDETGLDALVQAYALIQPHMVQANREMVRQFLTRWAQGYVARMDEARFSAKPRDIWANNWQSHRVKLVTMMAVATGHSHLFADARRLFWLQLHRNVGQNSEVMDFAQRDALHYVIYDLEPLLQAALAAKSRGEDWYSIASPEGGNPGGSLAQAVRWLVPFADGTQVHQEFVRSSVAFDAQRAKAGVKGYAGPFDPHDSGHLFWMAAQFDPSYLPLARRLRPAEPAFLALCGQ